MHIFCDFDGTISLKDTTDEILKTFALPEWENIEETWKQGGIGSLECMQRQIALIKASLFELDSALDLQQIDPDFSTFDKFCKNNNIPLTVISDGVDYFIKRILSRYDLDDLPVIANSLAINDSTRYSLTSSYTNPECKYGYGVCKCKQIAAARGLKIFIGDGKSDFCAVHKADIVFAKGTLAAYCDQQNIEYRSYNNFPQILMAIRGMNSALIKSPVITDLVYLNMEEYHGEYA